MSKETADTAFRDFVRQQLQKEVPKTSPAILEEQTSRITSVFEAAITQCLLDTPKRQQ